MNRLMRQSQQERRIAVQLLQARHEKEIIRKNRIIREKQYEERRLKDFEDALNRESVSLQQNLLTLSGTDGTDIIHCSNLQHHMKISALKMEMCTCQCFPENHCLCF